MPKVTEFITLTFKTPPSPDPPAAWADVTATLKSVPGVTSLYTGRQLEDPSRQVLVVDWASPEAFTAFASSEHYTPWFASLKAVAASDPAPVFYKVPLSGGSGSGSDGNSDPSDVVLRAPCTEVFVAYGVEPDFISKTAEFAAGMSRAHAPVEGFHGHAYGEVTTPLAFGGQGERGPAVTLLLGWDSKEAHLEAKGKAGPVSDNIHLLRSGRKDISMVSRHTYPSPIGNGITDAGQYHVNLKQV
ncbi:hypothetical protein CkaCkLH20_02644 [Colletotrichum karsti]|uniref:ABM domain-containing protein n=1 Tax=Colletotrichum karsti TaxID=1095194 RepID=A0A9P6I9V9_9PEZI|nr:uncharacterized protein CkaCkLH20_02644 [Colletotrichum karsti]KAF9879833.1 hypothetical protein CkaCkLH20_02644 [Colletotrichum karsti]